MKNDNPKTPKSGVPRPGMVPVYNPVTKAVTLMPARELAPGIVLASGPDTHGPAYVDRRELLATLKPSPYQHPPFDSAKRELMQFFSLALMDVKPLTPAQWEDEFRKDVNVDREIAMWQHLTVTYLGLIRDHACMDKPHNLKKQYQDFFSVLLQCLNVPREHVLKTVELQIITPEEAQNVVMAAFYNGTGETPDDKSQGGD